MPNIRSIDMKLVDDLFDMGGGYVLDFSDRTMSAFFVEELNVDIYDDAYREHGTSKAKRLRCFLNKVDLPTAVKTLTALWQYREQTRLDRQPQEWVSNAEGRFRSLLNRMQGKPDQAAPQGVVVSRSPCVREIHRCPSVLDDRDCHSLGAQFRRAAPKREFSRRSSPWGNHLLCLPSLWNAFFISIPTCVPFACRLGICTELHPRR